MPLRGAACRCVPLHAAACRCVPQCLPLCCTFLRCGEGAIGQPEQPSNEAQGSPSAHAVKLPPCGGSLPFGRLWPFSSTWLPPGFLLRYQAVHLQRALVSCSLASCAILFAHFKTSSGGAHVSEKSPLTPAGGLWTLQKPSEAYENLLAFAVRRVKPGFRLWLEHEARHVGKARPIQETPTSPQQYLCKNSQYHTNAHEKDIGHRRTERARLACGCSALRFAVFCRPGLFAPMAE